jgi:hypothetical protein
VCKIAGLVFSSETIHSDLRVQLILTTIFREIILWPPSFPDLNQCDYCLWRHQKIEYK